MKVLVQINAKSRTRFLKDREIYKKISLSGGILKDVYNASLPYVPYVSGITPPFLKGVRTQEECNSLSL
jgi:hypothetical protein